MNISNEVSQAGSETPTVWLSGAIQTFISKLVMPALGLGAVVGLPLWVYFTVGRISIRSDFRFIVWFAVIATALLAWLTAHLQLVGYRDRELIVANYWREARIPFEHIEAVEPVWWYKGRLVRIRFNRRTPFGSVIYYMPKWGPLRAMFSAPEEELRRIVWTRT